MTLIISYSLSCVGNKITRGVSMYHYVILALIPIKILEALHFINAYCYLQHTDATMVDYGYQIFLCFVILHNFILC